jgi:hypothetical protein
MYNIRKKRVTVISIALCFGLMLFAGSAAASVATSDRTASNSTITTGETVDVIVDIETNQTGGDVLVNDSFTGPINGVTGTVVESANGTVSSNVIDENGAAVLISNADPNSDITLTYNITASSTTGIINAVDGSDSDTSMGTTTIDVVSSSSNPSASRTLSANSINTSESVNVTLNIETNQNGDDVVFDEGFSGPISSVEGGITDSANGSIQVDSVNNQGTSFAVANPDPNSNITAKYNITASAGSGTITIATTSNSDISIPDDTVAVDTSLTVGGVTTNISEVDGAAGGIQNPQPITAVLDISNGTQPYPGSVNGSKLDIEVGSKSVTSGITTDKRRPGVWAAIFFAPTQTESGVYDLNVSFDDPALGNSDTANQSNAITYSSTGSVQASINLQLDESGSMDGFGNSKMDQAKAGAQRVVTKSSSNDYLSVVSYAGSSTIRQNLVRKSGNETAISDSISILSAGGGTNVGAAMQDGLTTMQDAPNGTVQAAIVMSDGISNSGPSDDEIVNNIVPQYNNEGVCVYTVGFGSGADEQLLKDIANKSSCGTYSFAAEEGQSLTQGQQTLDAVFSDIKQEVTDSDTIESDDGNVSAGQTTTQTYSVDDSVNVNSVSVDVGDIPANNISLQETDPTTVLSAEESSLVSTAQTDNGTVRLIDPNGNVIADESNQDIEINVVDGQVTYRISDPEPGQWSYEIVNEGSDEIQYQTEVTADAQATIDVSTAANTYYETGSADLTALFYGPNGNIENGAVTADVTQPDGSSQTVTFSEVDSGVYTAEVDLPQNGSYSVTTTASKNNINRQQSLTVSAEELSASPLSVSTQSSGEIDAGSSGTVDVTINNGGVAETIDIGISGLTEVGGSNAIQTSRITIPTQRLSVSDGGTRTITATIDVPSSAADGEYNGTARVYRSDGSVLSEDVSVDVNNPLPAGAVYTDPSGPAAQYDTDTNGKINQVELGRAGQAYLSDSINQVELGAVGQAYLDS